jgi:hypothetical protein
MHNCIDDHHGIAPGLIMTSSSNTCVSVYVCFRIACSGINRALRSSRLRDSRATDAPDDVSELGDDQNILELHISEATLHVSHK